MKMNLLEEIDRIVEARPELSRMLTLTVDPAEFPDSEVAHRKIGEAWNQLRTALRDKFGSFSYIWVREEQENGYPHLHILVSRYLPQEEVARLWSETKAGDVVDIRRVEARKVGNYISKYLAKDAMANVASGVHRYGSSASLTLGVRGSSSDGGSQWVLMAYDAEADVMATAGSGDFVRDGGKPPPPPACGGEI